MAKRASTAAAPAFIPLGPWPLGIDNVHPATHGVFQAGGEVAPRLWAASDVDLDDTGWVRRRPGVVPVALLDGVAPMGMWELAGRVFVQDTAGVFSEVTEGSVTELVTGLLGRVALTEHGGLIYGTNGDIHFEIDGQTVRNWGLPVPTLALTETAGALERGRTYLVQASFSDARGNEGGTSAIAAITLAAAGSIVVTVTGASADCTHVNLYAGHPEQEQTSFVAQVALAALPYTITAANVTAADPPKTEQMVGPFPDLTGLCSFRAFLLGFRDNFVVRSEAQEPHLFHPDSIMQFPATVTACEGLAGGLWVGTEAGLWWVSGEGPEGWIPAQKSFAGVARGSTQIQGNKLPALETGELVALFATEAGLVAGLPGGNLVHLTDGRYTFDSGLRVSFAYVERGDLRQLLISSSPVAYITYVEGVPNLLVAPDDGAVYITE